MPGCAYHVFNRGNDKNTIFFKEENYVYFLKRYQDYTQGYLDTYAYCLLENHFHFCFKVKSVKQILTTALADKNFKLNKAFMRQYVSPYLQSISDKGELHNIPARHELDKLVIQELLDETSEYYTNQIAHRALAHHVLLKSDTEDQDAHEVEIHPNKLETVSFTLQLCSYLVSQRIQRFFLSYAKSINKQQKRTGSLFQKCYRRKFLASDEDIRGTISYIHHNVIHHQYGSSYKEYEWTSYHEYLSREKDAITCTEAILLYGDTKEFIRISEEYRKNHPLAFLNEEKEQNLQRRKSQYAFSSNNNLVKEKRSTTNGKKVKTPYKPRGIP
jgi:REP element-mobilizing transposase RayT